MAAATDSRSATLQWVDHFVQAFSRSVEGSMVASLVGVLVILLTLGDCFESLVLPRRITRRWRLARLYYRSSWRLWRAACELIPAGRYRENALSIFGPLSLFGLFACWVAALI